jgi:hypothetical protein
MKASVLWRPDLGMSQWHSGVDSLFQCCLKGRELHIHTETIVLIGLRPEVKLSSFFYTISLGCLYQSQTWKGSDLANHWFVSYVRMYVYFIYLCFFLSLPSFDFFVVFNCFFTSVSSLFLRLSLSAFLPTPNFSFFLCLFVCLLVSFRHVA